MPRMTLETSRRIAYAGPWLLIFAWLMLDIALEFRMTALVWNIVVYGYAAVVTAWDTPIVRYGLLFALCVSAAWVLISEHFYFRRLAKRREERLLELARQNLERLEGERDRAVGLVSEYRAKERRARPGYIGISTPESLAPPQRLPPTARDLARARRPPGWHWKRASGQTPEQ
jgi:hypothetical protein